LLSTDTIFIGDDENRNIHDGDPLDIRTRLSVYSKAETYTQAEADAAFIEDAAGAVDAANLATNSVTTSKIADSNVTNAKIANGTVGAEKFQAGTTERDWVLARNASATIEAVGTYALLRCGTVTAPGDTANGANLYYSDTNQTSWSLENLVGPGSVWRCMGYARTNAATLWLRIS
jgi:hypothetical protein